MFGHAAEVQLLQLKPAQCRSSLSRRRPQPRRPSQLKQRQWIMSLLLRPSGTLLHGEERGTKSSTFSRYKSVLISRGCKPQPFSPLHHHHRRPRRQYHLPSEDVWPTHVSCHYDSAYEFCEVLKPIRVSLMMLADTSCCERGLAEYGSIHDDERARLAVEKVREVMAVRHYGPPSIAAFDPRPMYRYIMGILSNPFGGPTEGPQAASEPASAYQRHHD